MARHPPPKQYGTLEDSGRITLGVVLAALCCLPCFDLATSRNRWWLWSSSALWLSVMPFMLLLPLAESLLSGIGRRIGVG